MQRLAETLSEGLVERLRVAVPRHITLAAEVGGVTIENPAVTGAWCHISVDAIVDQDGDPRELVETAVYSVLSSVQDFVAEDLGEPWPGEGGAQPEPTVSWMGDELHVGFEGGTTSSLRLAPLPLAL